MVISIVTNLYLTDAYNQMPPPNMPDTGNAKIASNCHPHSLRSKRFRRVSEQRKTEEGDFRFWPRRNETRAKKWKRGEGEGKDGNACRQTPRFWKPAFASERSAWLARLVEQYWHVSIKGLFHTERSCMVRDTHINFLWLLFTLVGKICRPMPDNFL